MPKMTVRVILKSGVETKDTFTSKAKAVKAFAEGKTKKITGSEVADE